MAEEYSDEDTLSGYAFLEEAWWDAIDELRSIIVLSESTPDRIAACKVIFEYTAKMNQGLNAPFIPKERKESDDDDE